MLSSEGCPRDHVKARSRPVSINCLLRLSPNHCQTGHFKSTMAYAIDGADTLDADQLLAETLLLHNAEIDDNMEAAGLSMAPDSAVSTSVIEAVGEVDTFNSPTITNFNSPATIQQYGTDAFITNANDIVSPQLPELTEDIVDETSEDEHDPDDDAVEVNEDGTEAIRFASVRKRKSHAPMTEEQQRSEYLVDASASRSYADLIESPQWPCCSSTPNASSSTPTQHPATSKTPLHICSNLQPPARSARPRLAKQAPRYQKTTPRPPPHRTNVPSAAVRPRTRRTKRNCTLTRSRRRQTRKQSTRILCVL